MPRFHRSPVAVSLFAWLAIVALLPGVFEQHGTSHALGHAVHTTGPLEVSEVGHPGQALHIEATETVQLAPCPVCLHPQNPSLVLDLPSLPGWGSPRGDLATAEPLEAPRRPLGTRSARAPPRF